MPVLALAVTKNRGLGGLNNRHAFLTVLEVRNSRVGVRQNGLVLVRAFFLPCRYTAAFLLCPHVAEGEEASS